MSVVLIATNRNGNNAKFFFLFPLFHTCSASQFYFAQFCKSDIETQEKCNVCSCLECSAVKRLRLGGEYN